MTATCRFVVPWMRVSAQRSSQLSKYACASSRLSKRIPLSGVFCVWPIPDSTFPFRSGSWIRQGSAATPRTQKITWLLIATTRNRLGRWRSTRNRTLFYVRNRDGVANGNALSIDQNFFNQQPQDLLTFTNIQRLRACLQFFPECAQIFSELQVFHFVHCSALD